jgi:hypothetical protein
VSLSSPARRCLCTRVCACHDAACDHARASEYRLIVTAAEVDELLRRFPYGAQALYSADCAMYVEAMEADMFADRFVAVARVCSVYSPLLPAPCSLLPAPCSLLPASCSLLPAPSSLLPAHYPWSTTRCPLSTTLSCVRLASHVAVGCASGCVEQATESLEPSATSQRVAYRRCNSDGQ